MSEISSLLQEVHGDSPRDPPAHDLFQGTHPVIDEVNVSTGHYAHELAT